MMAFAAFNPFATALCFAGILLCSMFVLNPVISAISFVGAVLFCSLFTNGEEKKKDLLFYPLLFLLITATNPLFSHNGVTTLFYFNGNPVTLEAYCCGAGISLMIVTVLIWCKGFRFVMSSDRTAYLFAKASPKLSLLLSAALRYLPALKRQGHKIRQAQKAMGLFASDSYSDRLKATLRVFSALVGWSLENAVETGRAMQARGYGARGRTCYSDFTFRKADGVLAAVFFLLSAFVFYGILTEKTAFAYYPRMRVAPLTAATVLVYAAFAVMALTPALIEGRSRFLWHCYRSKI